MKIVQDKTVVRNLPSASHPYMQRLKLFTGFILKLAIAVALLAWLISKNLNSFAKALEQFNCLYLIPASIFILTGVLAASWRWNILLEVKNLKIGFWESLRMTAISLFYSMLIPGGAASSDIVRLACIVKKMEKEDRFQAAITIFMDRFIGMLALFVLTMFFAAIEWQSIAKANHLIKNIALGIIAMSVTGILLSLFLFLHKPMEKINIFKIFCKLSDNLTWGFYTRIIDSIDAYKRNLKQLMNTFLISILLIHIVHGLCVYTILKGMAAPISCLSAISVTNLGNTAGLLPLTPSGIGARDFVISGLLSGDGTSVGAAIAATVIYTGLMIAGNIILGTFFMFCKKNS